MGFLLQILREEDLFVDVGANIGSYTVLASAECGATSVSVEPNLESFRSLQENIKINNLQRLVSPLNIGLGSKLGILEFTKNQDTVNHVAVAGETETIATKVDTLDNIMEGLEPTLLKVDVEGYEKEVFSGAHDTLSKNSLKAIIVELVNHGKRYNFDDQDVHEDLVKYGFLPYGYDPFLRSFEKKGSFNTQNTIYIRDLNFVKNRVLSAPQYTFNKTTF